MIVPEINFGRHKGGLCLHSRRCFMPPVLECEAAKPAEVAPPPRRQAGSATARRWPRSDSPAEVHVLSGTLAEQHPLPLGRTISTPVWIKYEYYIHALC